jgi:glycosyltransferase involved in cell wall biosynthesis
MEKEKIGEKNPRVSIILPTYNGAKYINRAIESVLSQTLSDWELLVINDGSTDETEEIIKEYIKKDNRIIYLKQENQGPAIARKNGIEKSKGEYIAFIDDDDVWIDKNKLNAQVDFLDENYEYVMVGTSGIIIDETGEKIMDYIVPVSNESIKRSFLLKNPFIQSSVLLRKNIFNKIGEFPTPGIKFAQDYELFLTVSLFGKIENFNEKTISYFMRSGNISTLHKKDILKNNIELIRHFKGKYPNYYKAIIFSYLKYFIYLIIINIILGKKLKKIIFSFLFRIYRKTKF